MKIIITAAGLGSRFKNIGIEIPKFAIVVKGKSLFYWSVISLKKFFNNEFIFIFRRETYQKNFINKELRKLGIKKYKIILLNKSTRGQAETVMCAQKYLQPNDSLLIYNIDTHINPASLHTSWFKYDGLIVTTKAKGSHWSFAKTNKSNDFAIEVSEKIRISDHASVGLYYFKRFNDFRHVFNKFRHQIIKKWHEIYICPMYQYLINNNKKILIKDIPIKSLICLGTPEEIKRFDKNFLINQQWNLF